MGLSSELISQFAKTMNSETKSTKEEILYGTFVEQGDKKYVRLDGSELLTPAEQTAVAKNGERVSVVIKNHVAVITGNLSSPAARSEDVDENTKRILEVGELVADKVSTKELEAQIARIDTIETSNITITESLKAANASIESLEADNVSIRKTLNANKAKIDDLDANKLSATVADLKYATIENLEATNADIHNLSADYGKFKQATVDDLSVKDATIQRLQSEKLSATDADLKYANIDFSNIGKAAIEQFYATSGIIKDLVIGDTTVTGELVGVTIKGDLIEGGTVVADKLVVKGQNGLYYKLNTDGVTTEAEQTDYNSLNGSVITAKSITATKVNVDDLVAFDATIGGFNITNNAIYSGVKSSVGNTTRGIYQDKDGQLAVGDGSNYLKYFKDSDGKYKLEISAASLKFSASNKNLETVLGDTITKTVEEFYLSSSPTSLSGGSWSTKQPTWTTGKYIWRRTAVTYGDGSSEYTPSSTGVCITGNTGAKGDKGADGTNGTNGKDGASGVGISSITEYYAVSTSNTTPPTSWSTTVPTMTATNKYLWNYELIKYTNNTSKETAKCVIGVYGDKGATGSQGNPGIDFSQGKMLYTDPMFIDGMNSASTYDNRSTGNVAASRQAKSSDNPFQETKYELVITNKGAASPGLGGFCFRPVTRANAIYVYRVFAKIPTGYNLKFAHNSAGNNPTEKWLTSQNGTGRYSEYLYFLQCGSSGSFDSAGHFYIDGPTVGSTTNPIKWYVAYATVFDMTNVSDISKRATKEEVKTAVNNVQVGGRNLLYQYIEACGYTSKIDDKSIKIGTGVGDTYFRLKTHVALVKGETYTISCDASNVPSGCDWVFGVRTQANAFQLHINKNGRCSATGVIDENISANSKIKLDDSGGRPSTAPNIILSNFKLEKGNKATDWTPAPEDQVEKAKIISEINQSPEQISIKSSKISLEGLVTANQNFKVLTDGSIEAKNGKFTGTIEGSSGSFTKGFLVDVPNEGVSASIPASWRMLVADNRMYIGWYCKRAEEDPSYNACDSNIIFYKSSLWMHGGNEVVIAGEKVNISSQNFAVDNDGNVTINGYIHVDGVIHGQSNDKFVIYKKTVITNGQSLDVEGSVRALNGNRMYAIGFTSTNDKVSMWEDSEGGNIGIVSPNGVTYQMDAYNDNLRIYWYNSNNAYTYFTLQRDGNASVNGVGIYGLRDSINSLSNSKVGSYSDGTFYKVSSMVMFRSSSNFLASSESGNYIWGVSAWSDKRLKENIKDSNVCALDEIDKIQYRSFDFLDKRYGDHEDIGYVADELKEIFPECVVSVPQDRNSCGYDELYQVEDKGLIKYLGKAIQELHSIVKEQNKEIQYLKKSLVI